MTLGLFPEIPAAFDAVSSPPRRVLATDAQAPESGHLIGVENDRVDDGIERKLAARNGLRHAALKVQNDLGIAKGHLFS